jgi:hypothetical protein
MNHHLLENTFRKSITKQASLGHKSPKDESKHLLEKDESKETPKEEGTLKHLLEKDESKQASLGHKSPSKRDKKRYKRNIKKQRRAYFRDAVENKTYYDTEFLDTIHKWYFNI